MWSEDQIPSRRVEEDQGFYTYGLEHTPTMEEAISKLY